MPSDLELFQIHSYGILSYLWELEAPIWVCSCWVSLRRAPPLPRSQPGSGSCSGSTRLAAALGKCGWALGRSPRTWNNASRIHRQASDSEHRWRSKRNIQKEIRENVPLRFLSFWKKCNYSGIVSFMNGHNYTETNYEHLGMYWLFTHSQRSEIKDQQKDSLALAL